MNSNLNVDRQAGEEVKVDEKKERMGKWGLVKKALKSIALFSKEEIKKAYEQNQETKRENKAEKVEKTIENPNLQRAAEGGKKIIEGLADVGGGLYNGTKEAGAKALAGTKDAGAKAFSGAKESGFRHLKNGAKTASGVMTALNPWNKERTYRSSEKKLRKKEIVRIEIGISTLRAEISKLEADIVKCNKLQNASDKVRAEFNSNIEEIDELKKEIEDEKSKESFVKTLKSARVKTKMGKRFSRANPEKKIESLVQKNHKLLLKLNDQGGTIMSKEKEIEKKQMEIDALQEKLVVLKQEM